MACSADCSTIVLGSQDGNVWVLNKRAQVAMDVSGRCMGHQCRCFPRWFCHCGGSH